MKILIADDSYLIREGIKKTVGNLPNATIVGEVNDLSIFSLLPVIQRLQPEIILLEINLCDRPVRELVRQIRSVNPSCRILVISECKCDLPIINAHKAGIDGYVPKNIGETEFIRALEVVAQGSVYFPPEVVKRMNSTHLTDEQTGQAISERELEVLQYICQGRSNQQIAEALYLSGNTVATHRRNIMRKAGVNKTSDLILWALDRKVMSR